MTEQSFLSKTTFLTRALIEAKIGALEDQGIKQTVYINIIKLRFLISKRHNSSFLLAIGYNSR